MTTFIGDVHGKYRPYREIIRHRKNTIQVGDMGVGFYSPNTHRAYPNPNWNSMVEGNHRFIRGNHDNPNTCKKHTQWIKDGTVEGEVMFIGGAISVDREYRWEGYDYWQDEELSEPELAELLKKYEEIKPRFMVTHDCPESVVHAMDYRMYKLNYPSLSRQAFNSMLQFHQPEVWIFGHWHRSFDQVINGTRFVCLDELETKEIDVGL